MQAFILERLAPKKLQTGFLVNEVTIDQGPFFNLRDLERSHIGEQTLKGRIAIIKLI